MKTPRVFYFYDSITNALLASKDPEGFDLLKSVHGWLVPLTRAEATRLYSVKEVNHARAKLLYGTDYVVQFDKARGNIGVLYFLDHSTDADYNRGLAIDAVNLKRNHYADSDPANRIVLIETPRDRYGNRTSFQQGIVKETYVVNDPNLPPHEIANSICSILKTGQVPA